MRLVWAWVIYIVIGRSLNSHQNRYCLALKPEHADATLKPGILREFQNGDLQTRLCITLNQILRNNVFKRKSVRSTCDCCQERIKLALKRTSPWLVMKFMGRDVTTWAWIWISLSILEDRMVTCAWMYPISHLVCMLCPIWFSGQYYTHITVRIELRWWSGNVQMTYQRLRSECCHVIVLGHFYYIDTFTSAHYHDNVEIMLWPRWIWHYQAVKTLFQKCYHSVSREHQIWFPKAH